MIAFDVPDMTCGHCASTVTKAVQAIERDARVAVDLERHRVEIEARGASPARIEAAIRDAGYSPTPA